MIVVLNGASSCGKTSLAREPQRTFNKTGRQPGHNKRQTPLLAPYLRYCAGTPTYFVGMFCAPEALAARNANRDDRADGLAVTQQTQVHFCRDLYDLELDSTDVTPLGLARQVQQGLSDWVPRNGFKKLS